MRRPKYPLPRRYWLYAGLSVALGALLFVNVFVFDRWTGERELWAYERADWLRAGAFLLAEAALFLLALLFAQRVGKLFRRNSAQNAQHEEQFRLAGIQPGEYACVWFDFEGGRRALIAERDGTYRLRLEEFEARAEEWRAVSGASVFSSLPEVKRALFFDYAFACKENAVRDAHGDAVFRGDRALTASPGGGTCPSSRNGGR